MIANLIIRLCLHLARHQAPRVITGRTRHTITFWNGHGLKVGDRIDVTGAAYSVAEIKTPSSLIASPAYLTRYFLTRNSYRTEGMGASGKPPRMGLYLHCFHRSDDAGALHSHPWKWAVSLVLKGGYSEERRVTGPGYVERVIRRQVRPWSFNVLRGRDFHRVDLTNGEAWTLFLVGPVVSSWGFWDRITKRYTDWKTFLGVSS